MMKMRPLITICGTTGVGKSNLAIELALHLNRSPRTDGWQGARVINADSMQVYNGLDIITNKVPESERQGVEHLLMGFKAPGEQYVVGQWVQDALKLIDETHQNNQIPIVVGGTSYWIQHLIFPNRLNSSNVPPAAQGASTKAPFMAQELTKCIDSLPPHLVTLLEDLPIQPPSAAVDPDAAFNLHTLLSALDPTIASRWHWRDTRKVLRSLVIIKESGRRASDIIMDQTSDTSASTPRFRTLCFWLYAEPAVLEPRLNERIDKMIEQGLLNEIRSLHQIAEDARVRAASETETADYTLGIYQSIGYKEFHRYLSCPDQQTDNSFKDATDHMKVSTRQYAKRQISWIRNKLLPAVYTANTEETVTPTYLLDATELGEYWTTRVKDPAIQISDKFLGGGELPDPFSLSVNAQQMLKIERKLNDPASVLNARQKTICPVCTTHPDRPFMVEEGREWAAHQKTRSHRRLTAKLDRDKSGRTEEKDRTTDMRGRRASSESDVDSSYLIT